MNAAELAAYVRERIATAPQLTDTQKAKLRALLNGGAW